VRVVVASAGEPQIFGGGNATLLGGVDVIDLDLEGRAAHAAGVEGMLAAATIAERNQSRHR
jgi:hypothetical protein